MQEVDEKETFSAEINLKKAQFAKGLERRIFAVVPFHIKNNSSFSHLTNLPQEPLQIFRAFIHSGNKQKPVVVVVFKTSLQQTTN